MSKLEEWIRVQESKGFTDKQLEDHLIKQGYDKEDVDKIFLNMRLTPAHNPNHWLMWIGISFIILLLIVGLIYFFISNTPVYANVNTNAPGNTHSNLDDTIALNDSVINSSSDFSNITENVSDVPVNISDNTTQVNTSNNTYVPRCGNSRKDSDEECDGYDFGRLYCWNFTAPNGINFNGGAMRCTADCKIDTSSCGYCGDGIVSLDSGERCEGTSGVVVFKKNGVPYEWDVSKANPCKNFGYTYGTVNCLNNCTWSTSGCNVLSNATCGNGILEGDEECDYGIIGLPGKSNCQSFNYTGDCINTTIVPAFNTTTNTTYNTTINYTYSCLKWYIGGVMGCTQDCRHDFTDCR